MKFVNFKTEEDKKSLSMDHVITASRLELRNEFGDEVYLCMLNPKVDSHTFKYNTTETVYVPWTACIHSERMCAGEKKWNAVLFAGSESCQDYTPEKLSSARTIGHFLEIGVGFGISGLKNLLKMMDACYGAKNTDDLIKRRDDYNAKIEKNSEIQK